MKLVKLSTAEFEKFVAEQKVDNFLQSREMYERYADLGEEAYLLGVKKGSKVVLAALIVSTRQVFRRKVFRMAGGPVMDFGRKDVNEVLQFFTQEVRKLLRMHKGLVLQMSPNVVSQERDGQNNIIEEGEDNRRVKQALRKLGWKYLGEYEQVKWEYVLELAGREEDEMLMDFRTTHRQLIRKAERENVRVRRLGIDEVQVLKELTDEAAERHGFKDPQVEYYQSMLKAFGDKAELVVAEVEQGGKVIPIAAAMFMEYGKEIIYLFSGSARRWQKLGGSYAIQWEMIRKAMNEGYERYNFYGVRPVEGDGGYKFKQGFRGKVVELLGAFALPVAPILGRLYLARIKPREMGKVQ